ncbi:MAG: hypothetical protein IJQ80_08190 [Clostridia bacterium]|nr:hypothetical protein [Clostridia bacterium]
MKNEDYERAQLTITEFDYEDSITTSGEPSKRYAQDVYETPGVPDSAW